MLDRRGLLGALVLAPALARAQRAPGRGPNGGLLVVADGHPVELLVEGLEVTLFLDDDHGRPAPGRAASGRLVVQSGGQTATLALAPAAPDRLVGRLAAPLTAGARMVFTGAMADGHRIQARFVLD